MTSWLVEGTVLKDMEPAIISGLKKPYIILCRALLTKMMKV